MFKKMRLRSFLIFGIIVFVITSLFFGNQNENPVNEILFIYGIFVLFPFGWFTYKFKKYNINIDNIVQTKGIKTLSIPMVILFIFFFLLSIGIVWLTSFILSFFSPDYVEFFLADEEVLPKDNWRLSLFLALYIAVLGPIAEEFVFRGLFLKRIGYKTNTLLGLIYSSFLFAIFHFDLIGSFMTGIIFGFIYLWTNNLLYPILLHIANNSLVLLLAVFQVPLPNFLRYTTVGEIQAAAGPNIIMILIFAPLLYIWLTKTKPLFLKVRI